MLAEIGRKFGGIGDGLFEVADHRLYLKAVFACLRAEITESRRVGDFVEAGILISKSEVGLGAVSVKAFASSLPASTAWPVTAAAPGSMSADALRRARRSMRC